MLDFWRRGQYLPVALLGAAIWLGFVTWQMKEPAAFNPVSARLWPAVLLVTISICAIIIFLENLRNQPSRSGDEDEVASGGKGWIYVANLVVLTLALPFLGYLPALMLFLAATMFLYDGLSHPLRLVLTSTIGPVFVYLIITRVLGQALPNGILF